MGSGQCSLSTASLAPPLVRASQRSVPLFNKTRSTWPHLYAPLCFFALVFRCCSSCFAALVFHCCSSYFIAPFVSLLFFGASLLGGVSLLLCALLLRCSPRYLFAPCCFVVAQCFVTPLPGSILRPFLSFFEMCWKFRIVWEETWKHPS